MSNIVRWAFVGAIFGGVAGGLVGGGTAAFVRGLQYLQERRLRRDGPRDGGGDASAAPDDHIRRRPFVTFTSTSYSSTPWGGTTMSVTSNASGRRQRMIVRDAGRGRPRRWGQVAHGPDFNQLNTVDRRMFLQMLASNGVGRGAAADERIDRMTVDELLHQLRFPGAEVDGGRPSGNRGATPERIERCTVLRTLDSEDSVRELQDHRNTCNVCLEKFQRGDDTRKIAHCSHTFHKACIDRWLSHVASCPICKHELDP